jgi:hypothetical protein
MEYYFLFSQAFVPLRVLTEWFAWQTTPVQCRGKLLNTLLG